MLSKFSAFVSVAALLGALPSVYAHGIVEQVTIGGVAYTGYLPYQDPYVNPLPDRVVRGGFEGNGPVRVPTSADVQCNQNAQPAKLVAKAKSGDEVSFKWTEWPESHKGPVITYMAKAPEGTDITTWSPGTDAVWFKVDEAGFENGKWAATDILVGEQNNVWNFKIPSGLASGQYLIRHEIIALHAGFEGYPSCTQIELEGPGTATPSASDLVSFPGAYQANTPGIAFSLNVPFDSYPIPGPPVFGSGSTSPAPTTPGQPPATPSAPVSSLVPEPSEVAVPEPSEIPAPEPSDVPVLEPSPSSAEIPVPSPSSPAEPEVPASSAPEPVPSATDAPTMPIPTPTSAPSAPKPTSGLKDANQCMNEFNQCIAKSQPQPDWEGCGATKDACLAEATYNSNMYAKAKRNGRYGRLL